MVWKIVLAKEKKEEVFKRVLLAVLAVGVPVVLLGLFARR